MSIESVPAAASLEVPLSVFYGNQLSLQGQVVDTNGDAVDLTNYTLSLVLKGTAADLNNSGTTYTPTAASGTQGKWTQVIPGNKFEVSGPLWYRVDVLDSDSNAVTSDYGPITIIAA